MRLLVTRSVVLAGLLTGPLHASPANAQDGAKYLVVGPIFTNGFPSVAMNATVGAEHREGPGAIGVEGSYVYALPTRKVIARGVVGESDGGSVLDFSIYGAYHFRRIGAIEPFVKGGLGAVTDFSEFGWWTLEAAGGADWRLGRRVGLRTAVRGGYSWIGLGFEGGLVIR